MSLRRNKKASNIIPDGRSKASGHLKQLDAWPPFEEIGSREIIKGHLTARETPHAELSIFASRVQNGNEPRAYSCASWVSTHRAARQLFMCVNLGPWPLMHPAWMNRRPLLEPHAG